MAGRNIVIAMDESHHSDDAFEFYMKNVHKPDDHVILLYVPEYHTVIQSPMVMTDVSVVTSMLAEEEKRIKVFLEQLGTKLKGAGIAGQVMTQGGLVIGDVILKVVEEEKADLLVMGSRGMGGVLRRSMFGTVVDHVSRRCLAPVMVCKHRDIWTHQPLRLMQITPY